MLLPLVAALLLLDVPKSGVLELPAGETVLERPLTLPAGTRGLTIRAHPKGSTLVMGPAFRGQAAIVAEGARDLTLTGFEIRGNRGDMKSDWRLPPSETAFADYFSDNGILVRNAAGVTIRGVRLSRIRAFPVLVNASANVRIVSVDIADSGTLNPAGRNNTTGGILLEEGVRSFEIRGCSIRRVAGNAIWTHSRAGSGRQDDGAIRANEIERVGRDAIQVGHATRVRVEDNRGGELGFPTEIVDVETHGVAVALDTAGNVDKSVYANNTFTDVNGQCIDLDGFHDGQVTGNSCVNRKPLEAYPALHYGVVFGNNDPDATSAGIVLTGNTVDGFAYGGAYIAGTGNRIEENRFLNLNLAHCGSSPTPARCNYALDQPDLLRAAVYIANNGGRPAAATGNVIRGNTATGFGIDAHCVAVAPGVSAAENTIAGNACSGVSTASR